MLNAFPNQNGSHNGANVPTSPIRDHSTYSGAITTGNGTIIVASITPTITPRPRHCTPANPYATIALDTTHPIVARIVTTSVFRRYNGKFTTGSFHTRP